MKKGFSLIEIILIVALVSVTFVGVMGLTRRIMQMEHVVKNDFIAQGLLREGIELATAIRTENVSSSAPFWTDLSTAATNGSQRIFSADYNSINYSVRSSNIKNVTTIKDNDARIKYDSNGKDYNIAVGNPTEFYRMFTGTYHDGTAEGSDPYVRVKVEVYWESYGKGHTQTLINDLYEYDSGY